MKSDWQTVLGGIALTSAMAVAVPLHAQELDAWDTDQSGTLDFNEWNTGWMENSSWDQDGDGLISDQEYGQGIFDTYDANDDQFWDDSERQLFEDDAGEGGWLDM